MDRYVVQKSASASHGIGGSGGSGGGDLLSMMMSGKSSHSTATESRSGALVQATSSTATGGKQKIADIIMSNTTQAPKRSKKRPLDVSADAVDPSTIDTMNAWQQRERSSVSAIDISSQQRMAQIKSRNFTGWKVDSDGKKVYTTFRHGERVQASGKEGFMLAFGDGAIKKPQAGSSPTTVSEDNHRNVSGGSASTRIHSRDATDVASKVRVYDPNRSAAQSQKAQR